MTGTSNKTLLALALALTLAIGLGTAIAGQDDGQQDRRSRIEKKVVQGDDDIHARGHNNFVFKSDDGEVFELRGGHDGDGLTWVMEGDGGEHRFGLRSLHPGGFLGVGTTELTRELRGHFGVPEDSGVMVSNVVNDSGAFRAGILVGDIITAVDGQSVSSARSLQRAIRAHEDGDSVILEVWRDGKVENTTAILGKTEETGVHFESFDGDWTSAHEGALHRSMHINCTGDEDEDCDFVMGGGAIFCPEGEACEVTVSCEDEQCTCEVDGVVSDCEDIEGVKVLHLGDD